MKLLDSAMQKSKIKSKMTVHTGTHFDVGKVASQHPDRHIHLPAYASTSISKHTAKTFSEYQREHKDSKDLHEHVLSINLKKGHHALPILDHSESHTEHEVILPRHTTLKVADKPHETYSKDRTHSCGGGKVYTHFWDAHVVHQGEDHG